jgi:hypothetical protein
LTSPLPTFGGAEQHRQPRPTPGVPLDGAAQILREQFTYLLAHNGSCEPACRECIRFRRLAEILLEPFRTELYGFEQSH